VVAFDTPGGQETAGVVLAVETDRVQVDLNHPLSRHSLQIRVKVFSVSATDSADENP
jgi:FKBP-type peptidyl-prolyl cis-trans isomerase SlpA